MSRQLSSPEPLPSRVRFGKFVLERMPLSLLRDGERVKLTPQAARLLDLLVERSGEVVTTEEIRAALWPDGVHVDFAQGIHFNIRQLRLALDDESRAPKYIETVPRQGYRFVASVRPDRSGVRALFGERHGRIRWTVAVIFVGLCTIGIVSIQDTLRPQHTRQASDSPSAEVQALLDRGEVLRVASDPFDRRQAVPVFEEAIAIAPHVQRGHEGLIQTLLGLEEIEEAQRAAERLLILDPHSVPALYALAHAAFFLSFDLSTALEHTDEALRVAPNDLRCRTLRIGILMAMSRLPEALAEAEATAGENPVSFIPQYNLAWAHFHARQYERSAKYARQVLEIAPRNTIATDLLVESLLRLGLRNEAITAANRFLEDWGWEHGTVRSIEDWWRVNAMERTFNVQSRLSGHFSERAYFHYALGEKERSFDLLAEACTSRDVASIAWLRTDPRFDPLRLSPEFLGTQSCLESPSSPS